MFLRGLIIVYLLLYFLACLLALIDSFYLILESVKKVNRFFIRKTFRIYLLLIFLFHNWLIDFVFQVSIICLRRNLIEGLVFLNNRSVLMCRFNDWFLSPSTPKTSLAFRAYLLSLRFTCSILDNFKSILNTFTSVTAQRFEIFHLRWWLFNTKCPLLYNSLCLWPTCTIVWIWMTFLTLIVNQIILLSILIDPLIWINDIRMTCTSGLAYCLTIAQTILLWRWPPWHRYSLHWFIIISIDKFLELAVIHIWLFIIINYLLILRMQNIFNYG